MWFVFVSVMRSVCIFLCSNVSAWSSIFILFSSRLNGMIDLSPSLSVCRSSSGLQKTVMVIEWAFFIFFGWMGRFIKSLGYGCFMKHSWMVTFFLVVLFAASQVVGLIIVEKYFVKTDEGISWRELPSLAGVRIERPDVEPNLSLWYVLSAILVGTVLILLLVRFGRVFLWKLWFLLAVVMCLTIGFGAFLGGWWPFILALIFGVWKVVRPNVFVHNLTELFVYGGLAAIFVPILNVFYAFLLLVALSLYDMYAVWQSRHMIVMAKFQAKSGIFGGLMIPYTRAQVLKKGKKKHIKSEVKTAVLGGGDIGFPLIFAGTVFVSFGMVSALWVALGGTVALALLLAASQKDKFYPAMPFLTLGAVAGYVIALLL